MQPPAEHVHWLFATGVLLLGLLLLAEGIVGQEVWRRRAWRAYLWPSLLFGLGVLMWPVMVFYTNSTVHMLAHSAWAQTMMLAGAAELGLVRGKLRSELWKLAVPVSFAVSGAAFLIHEANPWLYSRSAFVHHACGWTLLVGSLFPLALAFKPGSLSFRAGYALVVVAVAVALYSSRDVAAIFGHLDPSAGVQHR
ncbi:MAG TPA: hypothetical protein VJT84_06100 [Gaiellaceae bacterium]|nr:hypothetical protein [Gaiellaceae bacterium]